MIKLFAKVCPDNIVYRVWEQDDSDRLPVTEGYAYIQLSAPFDPCSPPTHTSIPKLYGSTCVWVETATLADTKALKNAEINAARLAANRGTFPFGGKDIACDELSRSDIDAVSGTVALTGAMPANWGGFWKCTDNTYVSVPDVATWKSFYAAMVGQGSSNFDHAQSLKGQLAVATTVADVEAIKWN